MIVLKVHLSQLENIDLLSQRKSAPVTQLGEMLPAPSTASQHSLG